MDACSARQLDLFGEERADSARARVELVVANETRSRLNRDIEDLASEPTTPSPQETRSAARGAVLTKPSTGGQRTLPRLAIGPDEAAALLGVSRDYFDEHVIRELRVVRRGRRILIALAELERWLDRSATSASVGRA